jgi:hypothetical protein
VQRRASDQASTTRGAEGWSSQHFRSSDREWHHSRDYGHRVLRASHIGTQLPVGGTEDRCSYRPRAPGCGGLLSILWGTVESPDVRIRRRRSRPTQAAHRVDGSAGHAHVLDEALPILLRVHEHLLYNPRSETYRPSLNTTHKSRDCQRSDAVWNLPSVYRKSQRPVLEGATCRIRNS